MELVQIVLLIVIVGCFYEWNHLRQNTIKNDELWFFYFGVILTVILFITFFFETNDMRHIF